MIAVVSRPNPEPQNIRAASRVRLMALRLEDCATATIFVALTTVDSLGASWLRKDNRTPNYQSLGLLHGYKLGEYGALNRCRVPACDSTTNVRQAIRLLDCVMATSLAT